MDILYLSNLLGVFDQTDEATQPPLPPRTSDILTHLIANRSPPPKSPTVTLSMPLPPSSHQSHPDTSLYDPSEATVPPRPPKSSTLSRHPSSASSSVVFVQTEEELKPPPRPPKALKSNSASANASPNLDARLNADTEFDSPPIPPKPKSQNRIN
jgi:hypothetical protein